MFVWDRDGDGPVAPVLLAQGPFWSAGDVWSPGAAVWDGTRWGHFSDSGLASGDVPSRIIEYDGQLVGIRSDRVQRWNGSAWQTIGTFRGTAGIGGASTIYCLVAGEQGLYAGGEFITVNGVAMRGFAVWDGTAWSTRDGGINWVIRSIAESPTGVIVGGHDSLGPRAAGLVDGHWRAMDAGFTYGRVESLAFSGGQLWASGTVAVGTTQLELSNVAVWNGAAWQPPVQRLRGIGTRLHIVDGELFVTGSITTDLRNPIQPSVARFEAGNWSLVGSGLRFATAECLAKFNGELVAGGTIYEADGQPALGIAVQTAGTWRALGTGIGHGVSALGTWGDSVIAFGNRFISRWDGERWTPFGGALFGFAGMVEFQGELLIATGAGVREPNDDIANVIQRWDGNSWQSVPISVPGLPIPFPQHLVVHDDRLLLFVDFGCCGQQVSVLRWDGVRWDTAIGTVASAPEEPAPTVEQCTDHEGDLIVVGRFSQAGGVPTRNIARWNGERWVAMDRGLAHLASLSGIAHRQGELHVMSDGRLWKWNGESWDPVLTSSFPNPRYGKLVEYAGELYTANIGFGLLRHNGNAWVMVGDSYASGESATAKVIGNELWYGSTAGGSRVDGRSLGHVSRWVSEPSLPIVRPVSGSVRVRKGATLEIRFAVEGTGPIALEWMHDGVPVVAGGGTSLGTWVTVSVTEPSVRVSGTSPAAAGRFAARATNPCGQTISESIVVEVTCGADFDGDGRAGLADLVAYLNAWFARNAAADSDGIQGVSVNDLLLYITDFVAGCPE